MRKTRYNLTISELLSKVRNGDMKLNIAEDWDEKQKEKFLDNFHEMIQSNFGLYVNFVDNGQDEGWECLAGNEKLNAIFWGIEINRFSQEEITDVFNFVVYADVIELTKEEYATFMYKPTSE